MEKEKIERNPDLDALSARVAEVDGLAGAGAAVPAQGGAVLANHEVVEMEGVLTLMVGFVSPMFPTLQRVYTPNNIKALATTAIPVMQKHGWSLSGAMSKWGAELALAAVAIPLGIQTYQAVNADMAAMKKAKEEAEKKKAEEEAKKVSA